jgi:chemotaxis protein MotB
MGTSSWLSRTIVLGGMGAASLALAGCGLVPEGRLNECHQMSRTVQADNARLRDLTTSLRAQNQEMTLRAEDDARERQALEDERDHYKQAVLSLQSDREKMASEVERMKAQVAQMQGNGRLSDRAAPTSWTEQLKALAANRPGAAFDAERSTVSIIDDALFQPGTDQLTPDATAWLEAVARTLAAAGAAGQSVQIKPSAEGAPADADDAARARARFLSMSRANRVRDVLVNSEGLKTRPIEIAADEETAPEGESQGLAIVVRNRPPDAAVVRTGHNATAGDPSAPSADAEPK